MTLLLYQHKFLIALLITVVTEVPIVVILVNYFFKPKEIKISTTILVGIIASTLTLPYLWFVLPTFIANRILFIIVGESLIICGEAVIYSQFLKLKLFQAFIVSLAANIISIIVGLLVF